MLIKTKLRLLSAVIVCSVFVNLVVINFSIKYAQDIEHTTAILEDVQIHQLQLRKHEKDFLARKDIQFRSKFEQAYQSYEATLKMLEQKVDTLGIDQINTRQLRAHFTSYENNFYQLISAYEAVGLNEKLGLQGELRKRVHEIEKTVQSLNKVQLLADTLMLRRREKDFLLRMDPKYLAKFNHDFAIFTQHMYTTGLSAKQTSQLQTELDAYRQAFTDMVKGYEAIGFSEDKGFRGEMRQAIHQVDGELKKFHTVFAEAIATKNDTFYQQLMILYLLVAGLAVIAIILLVQKISRSTQKLTDVFKNLQQNYDFSIRSDLDDNDEIGQVGKVLNGLLQNLQQAFAEINTVSSALGKGIFDQRVQADMKGDLLVLKNGINESAESVFFTMNELEKVMHALYDGDFSVKMDDRVEGEFRDMVQNAQNALNGTISDIIKVMNNMQEGLFQYRVEAEARGDLLRLKHIVNNAMESLDNVMDDITHVVTAQSQGDLTQEITADYHGELGILKGSINATAKKLVEVVSDAINASEVVTQVASEVAEGASSLSQSVQEQAAALEETSATMEEMKSQVQSNTRYANQATSATEQVQNKTAAGVSVMHQTILAMDEIQESSHKISEIVSLIDGIAFQTNLLALNAAVEAARAGNHGRGFAVVAGEVRSLAQQSADAAKEIASLISETVERVEHGSKLASDSSEMLTTINTSIEEIVQMISQMAKASSEQDLGIEEVHKAIIQIDQVTQQNASLVEETSAAAESMSSQAESLNNEMNFFKTGKPEPMLRLEQAP